MSAGPRPARLGRGFAIGAAGAAVLLGALDTYVVISVLEDIMGSVGIPINKVQLATPIITCYLLGYIAAMPLLGRLSDRLGRRWVLQVGLALFIVGSAITALSDTVPMVISGRVVQGVASGALLPVTLALAADLWTARRRAAVLGGVGAAQELGSVLGPVVGIGVVTLVHEHLPRIAEGDAWRVVFFLNIPLAVLAMVLVQLSVPKAAPHASGKVDVVGGILLAAALALTVLGLYNPDPGGGSALPPNGLPLLIGALVALLAFAAWEWRAKTRLLDPAGLRTVPFLAACLASVAAGAALMVTLVDVELYARLVLDRDPMAAVLTLTRFLIALPIGAVIGGLIASRFGDRWISVAGMLLAAGGYLLISRWGVDVAAARHSLGPVHLPAIDVDLAVAGLGLGLVIGPLSSAALKAVHLTQAGIASALLVVARMSGMLIGVAALTAFGMHRLGAIQDAMPAAALPADASFADRIAATLVRTQQAYSEMFGEVFVITAAVCVVGAVIALAVTGRHHRNGETDRDGAEELVPSS